jgi:O-antigen ligase
LFVTANAVAVYLEFYWFAVLPFVFMAVWMALFAPDKLFWLIVFFVPLSLNTDEFMASAPMALYLPTEPLLFGMLLLVAAWLFMGNIFDRAIIRHPVFITYCGVYLAWLIITSLTSEDPLVSFKFTLAHLWLFVPVFIISTHLFKHTFNIRAFIWYYSIPLLMVVAYTVINHAMHGFAEKPAHWVMSPFFKDHTSYGAVLALVFPPLFSLCFSRFYTPVRKSVIVFLLILLTIGIVLSYTRAAWISLVGALGVWLVLYYRIRLTTILIFSVCGFVFLFSFYDQIIMNLSKNNTDSSDDLGKHIESISNISTDASNLERLNRWDCAITMYKLRPLTGWGPGTYQFYYASFQRPQNLTIISTNFGDQGNAHSEFLGPLAETGFPGMIIMIVLVFIIFWRGVVTYHALPSGEMKTLLMGAILGLTTYFIHGTLNNYLDTDKAAVPVWALTAIIAAADIYHRKLVTSNRQD